MNYFSLFSVSFVLFKGIYYITPQYYSLSEKLVAALTVTGECGVKTIADDNNNYSIYIFPANIPLSMFNNLSKTAQVFFVDSCRMAMSFKLEIRSR